MLLGRSHLPTLFALSDILRVLPVLDNGLELNTKIRDMDAVLADDGECVVGFVGAIPADAIWKEEMGA